LGVIEFAGELVTAYRMERLSGEERRAFLVWLLHTGEIGKAIDLRVSLNPVDLLDAICSWVRCASSEYAEVRESVLYEGLRIMGWVYPELSKMAQRN
jgi:hypothetical protein